MVAFGKVKTILIDSQITFKFRWPEERNKGVSKRRHFECTQLGLELFYYKANFLRPPLHSWNGR